MANTEHQESLDFLDILSVCLYRLGISVFAFGLIAMTISGLHLIEGAAFYDRNVLLLIAIAGVLTAANIHVYSKTVRTVISWSTWVGLLFMVSDPDLSRVWLSLGFVFVTFSGVALKESFCFKVPGLKAVPVLLAIATFAFCFEILTVANIATGLSGLIMGFLSISKWRMPLHFDIGIKANYEV
ncbi:MULTISPECIES: DUF2301 domain-containing membrane protein [Vibrio]|uniref:DUF2301 domain-containing membrane protein n=1 Tax=Vibrio TaxID=662 RepID=UPI000DF33CE3|nr:MULTISPECIES: DUF2301 domain-containing membrane protein [Vibrio]MPS39810.1 hypothetical protein [Vibrio sp. VGrn 2]RCW25631.1 putative integral membrane protein [Vibrio parahaemolyticus]